LSETPPISNFENNPGALADALPHIATESPYVENGRGYGSHQAILDLVEPDGDLLDVGCASGYLMARIHDSKGCSCVGIEPNHEAATAARKAGFRVIEDDALSSITRMAITDRFDQIIFGDVLEHMLDPVAVLKSCHALLKSSGRIIVSLPNIVGPRGRVPITLGIWRYRESGIFDETHLRFYSVKTGRELLRKAGYQINNEIFVGPLTTLGGRSLKYVTALRPNLLANQMIFSATPIVAAI
jgi:methionine biosynthesis protein MetW